MKGIVALALVSMVIVHGAGATPSTFKPSRAMTLATVPGPVVGFAQDGNHIVWANGYAPCGRMIQLKSLSTGSSRFLDARRGPLCDELRGSPTFIDSLALAGRRALWTTATQTFSSVYFDLFTAAPGRSPEHRLGDWSIDLDDPRLAPVPLAGDGGSLFFALRASGHEGDDFEGSGVYRVARQRARNVVGTAFALDVDADGSRFALARPVAGGCGCNELPAWSPDARRIAFVSRRSEAARPQVFVMNADGSGLRVLVEGAPAGRFTWAPDGTAIAVRTEAGKLVVARPDGSGARTVHGRIGDFAWSPDGQRLAYAAEYSNGSGRLQERLYVAPASGGPALDLGVAGDQYSIVWSPDSRRLAYTRWRNEHVYTIAASGGAPVDLGAGINPIWSPDSRRLAYQGGHLYVVSSSGGDRVDLGVGGEAAWSPDATELAFSREDGIYVGVADGSSVRRLAATSCSVGPVFCFDPAWSPDGRWIAFFNGDLWIVRREGGPPRRLRENVAPDARWSPNSRAIAYRERGAGGGFVEGMVMIADVDGGEARRVGPGTALAGDSVTANWASWSPDARRLLYVAESGRSTSAYRAEIAVVDVSGGGPITLTRTEPVPPRTVVETRNRSGKVLSSFDAPVRVSGLALSGSRVALVVDRSDTRPEPWRGARATIEVRATGGRLLRSLVRPRPMWGDLAMSGRWIVFRTWQVGARAEGQTAWLLDVLTGRTTILARAPGIVGLSIDGRRVAWGEVGADGSRIRAVVLPRG